MAPGPAPAGSEADIEQLRTQARRRLIGAVVLLAVGVVAFPLVFETEPRPMGVDMPMQRVDGTVAGAALPPLPAQVPRAAEAQPGPPPGPAAQAEVAPAPSEPPPRNEVDAPAPAVAAAPQLAPPAPAAPAEAADAERAGRAEAQRARALLEGRNTAVGPGPSATAAPSGPVKTAAPVAAAARYVVQVGAFTEQKALTAARSRVERLGLKTYTQVINSPAGPRTRVRVGPFDSRAEADAAGARLRAAGLQVAILSL